MNRFPEGGGKINNARAKQERDIERNPRWVNPWRGHSGDSAKHWRPGNKTAGNDGVPAFGGTECEGKESTYSIHRKEKREKLTGCGRY